MSLGGKKLGAFMLPWLLQSGSMLAAGRSASGLSTQALWKSLA